MDYMTSTKMKFEIHKKCFSNVIYIPSQGANMARTIILASFNNSHIVYRSWYPTWRCWHYSHEFGAWNEGEIKNNFTPRATVRWRCRRSATLPWRSRINDCKFNDLTPLNCHRSRKSRSILYTSHFVRSFITRPFVVLLENSDYCPRRKEPGLTSLLQGTRFEGQKRYSGIAGNYWERIRNNSYQELKNI